MSLTDEELLTGLKIKQCELMMNFTANNDPAIPNAYAKVETLNKIMKMQKLIDALTMKIALEKGEVYTTKFGQTVCSEEEFDYWNSIFDEIIYSAQNSDDSFGYKLHLYYQHKEEK